jgi:pantoate--beta-alanine ligase
MYPAGFDTTVHVENLARGLCGAARPGHFDGVATVVTKLLNIVRPHVAVFGDKDYQQLQLVRRLVHDLSIPVEILGMPVMREVDGLAMSSRNQRLTAETRPQATALYRAIEAAQRAVEGGETDADVLIERARGELRRRPLVREDYVQVVDPVTLEPVHTLQRDARILIAAFLGEVRLIDNGPLFVG